MAGNRRPNAEVAQIVPLSRRPINQIPMPKFSKNFKRTIPFLLLLLAVVLFWKPESTLPAEELTHSRLHSLIASNAILEAEVTPRPYPDVYTITGTYKPSAKGQPTDFTITTRLSESQMEELLAKSSVRLEVPKSGTRNKYLDIIPTFIVLGLIVALVLYHFNFGKGKNAHKVRQRPKIRFSHVAGIEESKAEVQEVVDFLRDPAKFSRLGGNLPKGILLIGPPGTGKTMLAKAMAGEADANFFSASGSDFTEIFVGVGAKRVREIFRQARKSRPAIIFIDEIDCLGKNRKHDHNGELQQTNNALLTEMDGFQSSEGVIVVGATNRPEDLDEALLRPGRFDRKVYVPLPDARGRRAILATHLRKSPVKAEETVLDVLAQTTPGMSGADLANLINEAAILSAQRNRTEIALAEFEEARDKVRFGKERKSMVLNTEERRVVAYHEAGHAIIYLQKTLLPPLHKVSIIPRGQALGTTTVLPREDQNIHSKRFLIEQLAVLMGGRAAEETFFGDMTNGANGDLDSAKNIARKMIHDWGMGDKLYYEPEKLDAEKEINLLLTNAYREALETIQEQKENTRKLAEALLTQETLDREQVLLLLQENSAPDSSTSPGVDHEADIQALAECRFPSSKKS
jgi:cell division protease FtsH